MSEQRVFLGSLAESTRAEEKNHRGTEGTEAEVAHLSVPSVPLWFKRLDKNVVSSALYQKTSARLRSRIAPAAGLRTCS